MNKLLTHEEVCKQVETLYEVGSLVDEELVSRFYACGEQGRDEDAKYLRQELLRRMESRIY